MAPGSSAPRLLIDGYNLALDQGTGVATYGRNLSYAAHELGLQVDVLYAAPAAASDPLLREITFFAGPRPEPALARRARYLRQALLDPFGARALTVPVTGAVLTEPIGGRLPYFDSIYTSHDLFRRAHLQFNLLGSMLRVKLPVAPELAHWTYPLPLRVPGTKNVYTLHDLVPLRLPFASLERKGRYLRLMRAIVRDADLVITVSENSRRDILSLLGAAPEKVVNTYQAVRFSQAALSQSEAAVRSQVESTLGLPYRGYFLFYGAIEPKKNLGRLLDAYLASGVEEPLLVIGKQAWNAETELRRLNDESLRYLEHQDPITRTRHRIRRLDYVSNQLLTSFICGARAVLAPSLYEGFGLPVLESMTLGTPVLTSSGSACAEIAGDAALLVDPLDVRAIAAGIRALSADGELRGDLARRGRARAQLFSPERYRERLGAAYRQVLGAKLPVADSVAVPVVRS